MSMKILSLALLVFVFCWSSEGRQPSWRGPSRSHRQPQCCTKYYNADVSEDVVGDSYREQKANPPCVRAFIFSIPEGKVCIDPNEEWAKNLTASMTKM